MAGTRYDPDNPYKHGGLSAVITEGLAAPGFPPKPSPRYDPTVPYTTVATHTGVPAPGFLSTTGKPPPDFSTTPLPGSHIAGAPIIPTIGAYKMPQDALIPDKGVGWFTWIIIAVIAMVIIKTLKK